MTTPSPVTQNRRNALDADMRRSQAVIAQSNSRAGSVAGLLGASLTFTGLVATVMIAVGAATLTPTSGIFGALAAFCLISSLLGLAVTMWPRLATFPQDKSVEAYTQRLKAVPCVLQETLVPTAEEYAEGFYLQCTVWAKEWGTRVSLVSSVLYIILFVATLATLKY